MNYLIAIVETHENGASAQIRANEFVRPGHEKCMERASDYPTRKMSPLSERAREAAISAMSLMDATALKVLDTKIAIWSG